MEAMCIAGPEEVDASSDEWPEVVANQAPRECSLPLKEQNKNHWQHSPADPGLPFCMAETRTVSVSASDLLR